MIFVKWIVSENMEILYDYIESASRWTHVPEDKHSDINNAHCTTATPVADLQMLYITTNEA